MLDLPEEFRSAAERIQAGVTQALGDRLTGVYVYGSALDSSFVPLRSDLDLIAVTESELDAADLECLATWFADEQRDDPAFERVQMSFLIKDRVLQDDPAACLYQSGSFSRSGSDGNPIIWLDFFQRGGVLCGAEPRDYLPEISDDLLRLALKREVGYLREEINANPNSEWRDRGSYRAYAVLTLCRILYSHATGRIASKHDAAEWVKRSRPGDIEAHQLIDVASGVSEQHWLATIPLAPIERFIGQVESELAGR